MKLNFYLLLSLLGAAVLVSCAPDKNTFELESPEGELTVAFRIKESIPQYTVTRAADTVIRWSNLGYITEKLNFHKNVTIEKITKPSWIVESYSLVHGKQLDHSYKALEQVVHLKNEDGIGFQIIFRVSDDGVAYRYSVGATSEVGQIIEEKSFYNFPNGTKSWLQPMAKAKTGWSRTNPSYEENYEYEIAPDTPSVLGSGWCYPALFQTGDTWTLISETGLRESYCGTRLEGIPGTGGLQITFPQEAEVMSGGGLLPKFEEAGYSPWRIMAIGSQNTVVESTLGTDLADPAIDMNTEFIKPGKASWSWVMLKDDSIIYPVQKRFIQYASDMNWQYCLIDVNWDQNIGFDGIKQLVEFGNSVNVGLILWYNSSGDWNDTPYTPKSKLITKEQRQKEFAMLKEMGISGLKIDFFGGDGQSVIQYYHDILKDAAENELMINFHGATLPRGWHRTYPNLMTMESIKGEEFVTFDQRNTDAQPQHCAVIPFTRNVYDPMDYTPMVFGEIFNIERKTTNGFEIALPVLFYSGIQHMAESDRGMANVPEYVKEYLRKLPDTWEETRLVEGYPGKHAVLARRSGNSWYVSGINGEDQSKEVVLDLSFLGEAKGNLITEGTGNRDFSQREVTLGSDGTLPLTLQPNGGFAIVF